MSRQLTNHLRISKTVNTTVVAQQPIEAAITHSPGETTQTVVGGYSSEASYQTAMVLTTGTSTALGVAANFALSGWDAQLTGAYAEVGEALAQLAQSDDNQYSIDPAVYGVATYVAAGLASSVYCDPLPSLFTHGSDSVVFNWTNDDQNLYLTVAADGASLLMSTPDRIQKRAELTLDELRDSIKYLSAIHSKNTQLIITTEGDVEPLEFFS